MLSLFLQNPFNLCPPFHTSTPAEAGAAGLEPLQPLLDGLGYGFQGAWLQGLGSQGQAARARPGGARVGRGDGVVKP